MERGTHQSLCEAGGVYADLWDLQSNSMPGPSVAGVETLEPAGEVSR
jgi:hypothetical protein